MSRTYITCVLTPVSERKITAILNPRTTHPFGKVTKTALRAAFDCNLPLEFRSTSLFHRNGAYFTVPEAVHHYGPMIGLQVHDTTGRMIAMIDANDADKVVIR